MTSSSVIPVILLFIRRSYALALGPTVSKPKVGIVSAGPIEISSLGCGTWSWGNRFCFRTMIPLRTRESMRHTEKSAMLELQSLTQQVRWTYIFCCCWRLFFIVMYGFSGNSLFVTTGSSYGTFDLNGRAEILLGQFEWRYQEEIKSSERNQPQKWW
jgi:hypothetical protein